jgi:hypothetical protein
MRTRKTWVEGISPAEEYALRTTQSQPTGTDVLGSPHDLRLHIIKGPVAGTGTDPRTGTRARRVADLPDRQQCPGAEAKPDLVAHTIEVITATQTLERAIQDAERGQRDFLITGNAAYLDPYSKGVQAIPELLARLKQLTADNPEQQRRWPLLEHQINVKLDELKRTIDALQTEGFDAARQIVQTNVG